MNTLVCNVCGYVALNGIAPEKCPVCQAPKQSFKEQADVLKVAADKSKMTELEKKHTPMIVVVKSCGLIPGGCIDVHVKIGEIIHPMTAEHQIQTIDFYLDKEFLSRVILTPEKVNPAAGMHLKANSGTLTVISSCNLHGKWINDAVL